MEKDFEEAEKELELAKDHVRKAAHLIGQHVDIPFNIDLAKLHIRHALSRFRKRRELLMEK